MAEHLVPNVVGHARGEGIVEAVSDFVVRRKGGTTHRGEARTNRY